MTTKTEDEGFSGRILMCLSHEIETARNALENIEKLVSAMQKKHGVEPVAQADVAS